MKTVEVTVLSDAVNNWVVRTPGRKYPGVVLQGDSLRHLKYLSGEVLRLAEANGPSEMLDAATELNELLTGRLAAYDRVLLESGFSIDE